MADWFAINHEFLHRSSPTVSSVSSSVDGIYQASTLLFYPFRDGVEGGLATTAYEVLGSSSSDEKLCHEWVRCSYFRDLGFGLGHSCICYKFLMPKGWQVDLAFWFWGWEEFFGWCSCLAYKIWWKFCLISWIKIFNAYHNIVFRRFENHLVYLGD